MKLQPCGTPAAYRRHLRRKEQTCSACRAAHSAAVRAHQLRLPVEPRQLVPCGSPAAYERHIRRGEPTCRPCCDAHAAYKAAYLRRRRSA